jgi:hypothetical protein
MQNDDEAAMMKKASRYGDRLVMDMGNISQDDDIEICFEYLIEMPFIRDLTRTVDGQERQRTGTYAARKKMEADGTEKKSRYQLYIPMLPKPRYFDQNRTLDGESKTDIKNLSNIRSTMIEIEIELFTNAIGVYKPPTMNSPEDNQRQIREFPMPPPATDSATAIGHGYERVYDLKPSNKVEDIRLYLEFDQEGLEQELAETTGRELKKDLLQESDNYLETESLSAFAYGFDGSLSLQVEAHVERNENYKPTNLNLIQNMNKIRKEREYIFVVDCSGSMLRVVPQVKGTLRLLLNQMTPGECTFNIVKFGSHHDSLFPNGAVEYNEDNYNAAVEYINGISSNMGGTNILDPLREVLRNQTATTNHKRQVFLLTDGAVANQSMVISTVRSRMEIDSEYPNDPHNRVFTLGIGSGHSSSLCQQLADATNGNYESVFYDFDIPQAVATLFNASMTSSTPNYTAEIISVRYNLIDPRGLDLGQLSQLNLDPEEHGQRVPLLQNYDYDTPNSFSPLGTYFRTNVTLNDIEPGSKVRLTIKYETPGAAMFRNVFGAKIENIEIAHEVAINIVNHERATKNLKTAIRVGRYAKIREAMRRIERDFSLDYQERKNELMSKQ